MSNGGLQSRPNFAPEKQCIVLRPSRDGLFGHVRREKLSFVPIRQSREHRGQNWGGITEFRSSAYAEAKLGLFSCSDLSAIARKGEGGQNENKRKKGGVPMTAEDIVSAAVGVAALYAI